MDELIEQAEQIVDLIRKQNWASSGLLVVNREDAIAAVDQLVRTAYSKGATDATAQTGKSMLAAFDAVSAGR